MFAFFGTLWNFIYLIRILFGPFPLFGAVALHYGNRILSVSFLTMLFFKTIVHTLFVIDFDRMATIGETGMIIGMGVCTFTFTVAHVAMEALLRNHLGLEHYPRWCFSVYISKVRPYQFFFNFTHNIEFY